MERVNLLTIPRQLLAIFLLFLVSLSYGQQYNFRSYSLEEGLPQSQVNALIQDNAGNIWVGTHGGGLARFNGTEFQVFTKKHGLPDNLVSALYQDNSGIIWIATANGISAYDGKTFRYYGEEQGVQEGQYFMISQDNKDRIWVLGVEISGKKIMMYLEEDGFHNYAAEHPELTEKNLVLWMYKDVDRGLCAVTQNGLFSLESDSVLNNRFDGLFPEGDIVVPFLKEKNGYVWLVSGKSFNDASLYKHREGELSKIELPPGITTQQFRWTIQDGSGDIWISLYGTGILRISQTNSDNPEFQLFSRSNGLPNNMINNILEDREGNIWLGSNGGGLIKYSSDRFVALNLDDGLSNEIIWSITQDHQGNFWFGSGGGAIIKYNGTNIENVITEENSPIGFVRKLLELDNGHLLIASMNGLWEYDGKDFQQVNQHYGLQKNDKIGDMIRDGNELLIGVLGRGVARYDGRRTAFITAEKDGIISDRIDHLMKDSKGNIWMSSRRTGVSKYQSNPLRPLEPQGTNEPTRVVNYDSKNGLNNDYISQIAEDKNGNLWLASYGGGLNIFDGREFQYLDTEKGLTSDNIYSVIADDEGNIWAGTQNGVDKITIDDQGEITSIINYDKYDGFTGIESNSMANFKDHEGNLWFGTIKGVMRYKPSSDQVNPTPPVTNITRMKLFFKDVDWNEQSYQKYLSGVDNWHQLPRDLMLPYDLNHVTFSFEALSFRVPEKVKYQWKLEGLDKEWAPVTGNTEAVYPNLPPGSYRFQVRASNNDGVWNEVPASFSFKIDPPWWGTWWFKLLLVAGIAGLAIGFYKWRVHSIKQKKNDLEQKVRQKTTEVVRQKDEILVKSKQLEESYHNLELLSDVGKSITSNLSVSKIIDTVYENVNSLMKAEVFWIGIYQKDISAIEFQGGLEAGEKLPNFCCSLADKDRLAVWCFENQEEVFINDYSKEYKKYTDRKLDAIAGEPTQSIIYVPLVSQGRPFGVISVQSYQKNAYDEHHLSLIRNIAVHTKIALENASAYEKITEQSKDLLQQKEQIEHKNQELLELNKEKNHLIGIVAHDLRNPLTSALTIGGLLKSAEQLSEEQREYAEHMVNAMGRMNDMVNRILDIKAIESKSIELDLRKTNLAEVLLEVRENFKEALENKQLEFNFNQKHPEPTAMVDRNYLTQIYENLVSNAIKFSPPKRKISVDIVQDNGQVITEIKDQGPGLTKDDLPRLFQKYQKLSARPTGGEQSTGLGLSIVKKYVEAMDGRVWAESEPGRGATFKVEFDSVTAVFN